MKLKTQPPRFPYLRDPFPVQVAFEGGINTSVDYSQLRVCLFSGNVSVDGAEIVQSTTTAGVCKLTVQITNPRVAHSHDMVQLCVSYKNESAKSDPFQVVLHRVQLVAHSAQRFFKDKGGKNNYMTCEARVMDKNNAAPVAKIKWHCTLLYNNLKEVDDQSILKFHFVEKGNGSFLMKYRIEQVSRAHCNRDFCVRLHAADDPTVSFDTTQPVNVLSKVNNRNRVNAGLAKPKAIKKVNDSKKQSSSSTTSPSIKTEELATFDEEEEDAFRTPPANHFITTTVSSPSEVVNLCQSMNAALKQLEWQACGYHTSVQGFTDINRKVYRCNGCGRFKADPDPAFPEGLTPKPQTEHEQSCPIASNLKAFADVFQTTTTTSTTPFPSDSFSLLQKLTESNTSSFPGFDAGFGGKQVDLGAVPSNKRKAWCDSNELRDNQDNLAPVKLGRTASWTHTVTTTVSHDFGLKDFSSEDVPSLPVALNTNLSACSTFDGDSSSFGALPSEEMFGNNAPVDAA